MTAEQFAYWLNGFAELQGTAPTEAQWESIKEHLNLVFNKVTKQVSFPLTTTPWPNDKSPGIMDHRPFINPNQPMCDLISPGTGIVMQAETKVKPGLIYC